MAIAATDIVYRLSGGASNSSPGASLGGAKSSIAVNNTLFDNVTSSEASSGLIDYRCFYVHNAHASLTMLSPKVFIQSNTVSPHTTFELALGSSALNGTEQTIANDTTAPTGVTFSAPADYNSGIALGDILAGQSRAVWIKRITTAGAVTASDQGTLRVQCDTLP